MRNWIIALPLALVMSWSTAIAIAQEQTLAISIRDNAYDPPEVTIVVGTTITWTNQGLELHTVTDQAGRFDSAGLSPGAQFVMTFTEPGEFQYLCMIHDKQDGIIRVVA
jgi:plastocyanin